MTTVAVKRISEIKKTLISELQDYVDLLNMKEETLKAIVSLPPGEFSHFHGEVKSFGENRYVPDYIQGLKFPKSQYQFFSLIKTIKDVRDKKILVHCFLDKDGTQKGIWFDSRTQNYSVYLGALGIHAKESTCFIKGGFFPDKI